MKPTTLMELAVAPAFGLLPSHFDTPAARAMVVAIGLQESDCSARKQMLGGPARSYAQFEPIAIEHVLTHRATRGVAIDVCEVLDVASTVEEVYEAIAYNDLLMVAFTRLNLWTSPLPLPRREEVERGWELYVTTWKPGHPRREKWDGSFQGGWWAVDGIALESS